MKKTNLFTSVIILLFASGFINRTQAQVTRADAFQKETQTTWLGIDFSEAKYFGDPGNTNKDEMKSAMVGINYVVIDEPKKYDLKKAFDKFDVVSDIKMTSEINEKIDAAKIMSYSQADLHHLTAEKIQAIVKKYKFEEKSGIAIVFIVEALNKAEEKSAYWVTIMDAANKNVLFTERIEEKGFGFGFKNHWAGSIAGGLKDIDSKLWKRWRSGGN